VKRITLTVETNNPEHITRSAEAMSRAAAGLALEGIDAFLMIREDTDDED
jgi:hypothetical protein